MRSLILMLTTTIGLSALTTMCAGEEMKAAASSDNLVLAGHDFALEVCSACHVVAKGQKSAPILKPPAPVSRNCPPPEIHRILFAPFPEFAPREDARSTACRIPDRRSRRVYVELKTQKLKALS